MVYTVACATLGLSLSGCIGEMREARRQAIEPLDITLRVVDDDGRPIPGTVAQVTQNLNVGERFFCISLMGGNCAKYKRINIFKGEVGDDGEQTFKVGYSSNLTLVVAKSCPDPAGHREYFIRHVKSEEFSREPVVIMKRGWNPSKGMYVSDLPCATTTPPLRHWSSSY